MKKQLRQFLPVLLFAIIGLLYSYLPMAETPARTSTQAPEPAYVATDATSTFGNARVVHVVDGDTISVLIDGTDKEAKVRLIGVNTPETVDPRRPVECFGKEASAHVKGLLTSARVLLEADPEADEIDKYGRLLRYVYTKDGHNVDADLIQDGYGFAYTSFPMTDTVRAEFLALEREARDAERGLWSPDACRASAIDK